MSKRNGTANNTKPVDRTWLTRKRAWLFAFSGESLFGRGVARVTSGDAFKVYAVWPGGESIPKGESESTKCVAWKDQATEFFLAIERTEDDLRDIVRAVGPHSLMTKWAFWLEPTGLNVETEYRVRYAMRPGTSITDVMILRDKLATKGRGLFMQALQTHNMEAIRRDVDDF